MSTAILIPAPAALLIAACAVTTPDAARGPDLAAPPDAGIPVRGETPGSECSDAALAQFAGQQATSELGARILQVSGARTLRWVQPGQMVTMEFRADRVTVHLDAANRVDRATCG